MEGCGRRQRSRSQQAAAVVRTCVVVRIRPACHHLHTSRSANKNGEPKDGVIECFLYHLCSMESQSILSRISTAMLTRDMDIGILFVRPFVRLSVCHVPVCIVTISSPSNHFSFMRIKHLREIPTRSPLRER